ncbi:MAG: GvpL/GvpF family gas vesicle protein [Micromonosporaceae bacterium]
MTSSQPATRGPGADVRGLYAYAITTDGRLDLDGVPSIDDGSLRVIGHAGIGLVVSDVALSTLDTIETDDLAEDGQLAGLVRTHDAVIRAVAEQAPVLPLRFGTVITDRGAAVRLLQQRHDDARQLLSHVAGHREFGVRLRLTAPPAATPDQPEPATTPSHPAPPATTPSQPPAATPDQPEAAAPEQQEAARSSGTAYLARRREERDERERATRRRNELVAATHDALASYAKDAVLRTSRTAGTVSDAAYLVAPVGEPEFFAETERQAELLRPENVALERTGPWPPYSFVRGDTGTSDD